MAEPKKILRVLKPAMPARPPPKRPEAPDPDAAPVSGPNIAKLLAKAKPPPWVSRASAARGANATVWAQSGRPAGHPRFLYRPTPGMQPPPVGAFGNPNAVARHAYLWDPETTMAAHFRPDRHSSMIRGRPVQAPGGVSIRQ